MFGSGRCGWLNVLAAAGVASLVLLRGGALAWIAVGVVVPLHTLFLWLTLGTIAKVSPRQ